MRKQPFASILGTTGALLLLGLAAGCQTNSGETAEPAYVVGVTPIGMRLDPIIWGTLTHFDIESVDGETPHSKSRVSVSPGEHTFVINAVSGWSGKSNSSSVTLKLVSGHTYLLRPTSFEGFTYVIVIDNDEGTVVFRPKLELARASAPAPVAAAAPAPAASVPVAAPVPTKPDNVEYNPDGTMKTKGVYELDAKGRVTTYTVYDGLGVLQYTESSYYANDGRIVRTDRRDANGILERVVVYFDTFETILDRNGNVIGTQELTKSSK
jgi:hypothetical protein